MNNEHIFNKPHYEWLITTVIHLQLNREQIDRLVYLLAFTNPRFDHKWFRDEVKEFKSYNEYDDTWGLTQEQLSEHYGDELR